MWIFMNDAALSVVANHGPARGCLVRARVDGDIERVFPRAQVWSNPDADYTYRAVIPRMEVAEVISDRVLDIDYGDFKGSVPERARHDAYLSVWAVWASQGAMLDGRAAAGLTVVPGAHGVGLALGAHAAPTGLEYDFDEDDEELE